MTPRRVTMIVLGGALLTSWLVAAAGTFLQTPEPQPAPRTPQPDAIDALATGVQVQADRLRARLDAAPTPRGSGRNPFTFASRAPRRERPPRTEVAASAVVEAPRPEARAAPAIALVGIATGRDGRRAVLSVAGDVVFVVVGDTVADRYRVSAVSADVVELEDARGGPPIRLGLR